jgi:hypothetical protein
MSLPPACRYRAEGEGEARVKQIVLRAYQLARSGKCATLEAIFDLLRTEGYQRPSIEEHLADNRIRADLTKLCEQAKGEEEGNR